MPVISQIYQFGF